MLLKYFLKKVSKMREALYIIDGKVNLVSLTENKTILDDLLEKYPHVKLDKGVPINICPDYLGYKGCDRCIHNCRDCWNSPLESM